jgi:hypothetical protein
MYGLRNTEDLSFLIDACVSQIVVSLSALRIDFDQPVRLTIFSAFAVSIADSPLTRFDGSARDSLALFPLISDVVTAASATTSGGLQVNFKSGAVLEVFDDSKQYESFTISNGDQLIVV